MSRINSIFISRKLSKDSPFWNLTERGIRIVDQSLLEFKAISFEFKHQYDWLFFYSKNGIRAFLDQYPIPQDVKIGLMGQASDHFLNHKINKSADFIFDESHNNFEELNRITADQNILFVEANYSKKRFQDAFTRSQNIHSVVNYTNEMKKEIEIQETDLLIFTSPLNVKNYFLHYPNRLNKKMVAIGPTTQKMVLECSGKIATIPSHPYEKDLFDLIRSDLFI